MSRPCHHGGAHGEHHGAQLLDDSGVAREDAANEQGLLLVC